MKFFSEKKTISGCEARGDADSPYLTRITVLENRWGKLYLHIFHRSDGDEMHDHPFDFVSLILWRGYYEDTPTGCKGLPGEGRVRGFQRKWPGMVLFRRATWRHRVVLVNRKPAVTLVWRWRDKREWGFIVGEHWVNWRDYFREKGC